MAETGPAAPCEALAITGPTASGKTRLAIEVARAIGGEIISMDSRQVYRRMDIGTAKPDAAERAGVPHYGFDRVDPGERYSAGRFAREAGAWIADIRARHRLPILAGGTGFFLHALTHPLFAEPPLDEERRVALHAFLEKKSADELKRWASTLEPASLAGEWKGGGRQRWARRIEVAVLTGRPLSWWHERAASGTAPIHAFIFVLDLPREELRRRIDARVAGMARSGLVEEVRSLLARGYDTAHPGMNATGYTEVARHLRGEITLDEAIALTQSATWRYARRQLTWFRNQLAGGVRIDAMLPVEEQVEQVIGEWKGVGS